MARYTLLGSSVDLAGSTLGGGRLLEGDATARHAASPGSRLRFDHVTPFQRTLRSRDVGVCAGYRQSSCVLTVVSRVDTLLHSLGEIVGDGFQALS